MLKSYAKRQNLRKILGFSPKKQGVHVHPQFHRPCKNDLENYKFSKNEDRHEDFQPILTTRGMCYTFNSQILSDIWKPSKVTTAFIDMFPTEHVEKYFGGTGRVQGIFLTKIKRLVGHYYILL